MANNNIEPIPVLEPEKTSLKDLYSEIERLFDFFNEKLYDSKLKKPVITIQSGAEGKRKSAGWFASNRWQFNRKKTHITVFANEYYNLKKINPFTVKERWILFFKY